MRNQLPKLYNAVSAPVSVTREALAERLQSVRKTVSLLYNRMMEKYGIWTTETERYRGKRSKGRRSQGATARKKKTSI